jgi:hypothetical protein
MHEIEAPSYYPRVLKLAKVAIWTLLALAPSTTHSVFQQHTRAYFQSPVHSKLSVALLIYFLGLVPDHSTYTELLVTTARQFRLVFR